jgi:hypothetical protein
VKEARKKLQVYFGQNRSNLPINAEGALWVSVKIHGGMGDRKGLTVSSSHYILIDCSGSMGGTKLDVAKEALRQYVNTLSGDDEVTLVSFGESADVSTVFQHKKMDPKGKSEVAERIQQLSAGGGTPLYAAVREVVTLARDSPRNISLLLLTDGQASDVSDPALYTEVLAPMAEKISRSYVMGIGTDYDHTLLWALKNTTNGEFENLVSPDQVLAKFQEISQRGRKVVAQAPRMTIKLTRGTSLNGIFRIEPQIQDLTNQVKLTEDGESEVIMPDIIADEDQSYAMMLGLPARAEGEYREGRIRFQGFDYQPYDIAVGRSTQPASLGEIDPAPRLIYNQAREQWIATKAMTGDRAALAETQKILSTYQNNPEKAKTMPISHLKTLESVTQALTSKVPVDGKTQKAVTAKLTKKIET